MSQSANAPEVTVGGDASRGAGLYDFWCAVRQFGHGLALAWIPALSLVGGIFLFFTPQAQDLFLEVRGSPLAGAGYWLLFYVLVLAIWVLPIYVSARWLLWQFRTDLPPSPDYRPVADWVRQAIPPMLAAGCLLTLLLGQGLALFNVPDLVDLNSIEANISTHRENIEKFCSGPRLECLVAYARFFGDGALWILYSEWRLGTEWMIFLLYAFASGLAIWNVLGYRIAYVDNAMLRLTLRVVWWIVTILTLPAVVFFALVFYGYLWAEAQSPHTVVHLALLPGISILFSYLLWRTLKPNHRQAPLLARWLLARSADEDFAMRYLVQPLFWILVGLSFLATIVLLLLDPLAVTSVVGRVQLVPFLLGPLVPPLALVSSWSVRLQAPLVVCTVLLVGIANSLVPDRHGIRTIPKPQGVDRQTLDQAIEQWTKANGCSLANPQTCPSPIVIAAAGGASRAGFLLGGLIGKLIDERTTLAALGPERGQPPRNLLPFENQLFAISAVSGGSLGAVMSYAALAERKTPPDWPARGTAGGSTTIAPPCRADSKEGYAEWYGSSPSARTVPQPYESWQSCLGLLLSGDFLSPVFVKLIGTDMLGLGMAKDRAVTLEEAWEQRFREITGSNALSRGLAEMRADATAKGTWLPVLLLNGTSVEAGRRIITSDILIPPRRATRASPARRAFVDAQDLHEMMDVAEDQSTAPNRSALPQSSKTATRPVRDLALSTAATMSARFPFITPHGSITAPDGSIVDRVVDGGYYENYGALTALDLVRQLKSVYRLTPTVILVNNEPTTDPMDCVTDESQLSARSAAPQRFWFSTFNAPLDAVARSRSARGSHAAVELCSYVRGPEVGGSFSFITVRKSGDKPLSMSWWLSKHVQQYLALHLAPDDATTVDMSSRDLQFRQVNQKSFREIVDRRLAR